MTKRYLIPAILVGLFEKNAARSFIEHRPLAKGEFALFNKNGLRYQYFQNCVKLIDRYAYIAEAEELDPYFRRVIKEVD